MYSLIKRFNVKSLCWFTAICSVRSLEVSSQSGNWEFTSLRTEIDPLHQISEQVLFDGNPTLMLSGAGKKYVNGSWAKLFNVTAGAHYRFATFFQSQNVEEIDRSILASINWLDDDGQRVAFIEFPALKAEGGPDDWKKIEQVYQAPAGAVKARVNLIYRWDSDGQVFFNGATLEETDTPGSRMVKVAVVHHRPRNTKSVAVNLEQFGNHLEQAGAMRPDIVCLPEGITLVGNDKTYLDVSEPVPGPTTEFLGKLARKHKMYVVAGILEKDGPVLYNTAVLIDRDGKLAGKYRKVSLPREEIEGGVTPGDDFPVFDTDFGRIGIMICWDVFFPEPARMLSLKGAEMIFMPIWGGNLTLSRARAIENQIYLVSSTYDMKSGVFDKTGELIIEGTEENPVVMTDIDLNQREMWEWLGEFKNRIRREMPDKEVLNY
jgi:predicted amidohydrolase